MKNLTTNRCCCWCCTSPGWVLLFYCSRQTYHPHHQRYVNDAAPCDSDAYADACTNVQGSDAYAQAEKRRQSGLPWLLVTALMIAAQLVGASLAATDFGAEYNVNDDSYQIKTDL